MKKNRIFNPSKFVILVAAVIALSVLELTQAYDIGCIYPPNMPEPLQARHEMSIMLAIDNLDRDHKIAIETPIAVHISLASARCGALCLAYHDSKVLNPITMKPPFIRTPEFGHNAYSMAMCNTQCMTSAVGLDDMGPILDHWGLLITERFTGPFEEIIDKEEFTLMDYMNILKYIQDNDYHPFVMGQLAMLEILNSMFEDGWNTFGDYTFDVATQSMVNCTANCANYADVSGYQPRNPYPRPFKEEDKYKVAGDDMHWQPLLEDNGDGYFSRQEHVTPHLGTTAIPILDENLHNRSLPPPNYDYYEESLKVIEELQKTANSVDRRDKVIIFDNKFGVRGLVQHEVKEQFKRQHSYQRHMMYIVGIAMSEDEGIVAAWMEKVRHDLVRPTTVIQKWGSDKLLTYNGDPNSTEASEINARDFQAFIRVMPHSEYPSGSSCLCTTYHNFTKAFTEYYYSSELGKLHYDDGIRIVDLEDMDDFVHTCGQSRLWGGMHFSKAVPAGVELCDGLGNMSFEKVRKIFADTDFGGNEHFFDSPRPVCKNETAANSENTSIGEQSPSNIASMCSDCKEKYVAPKTSGDHDLSHDNLSSDCTSRILKMFLPCKIWGTISLLFFLCA